MTLVAWGGVSSSGGREMGREGGAMTLVAWGRGRTSPPWLELNGSPSLAQGVAFRDDAMRGCQPSTRK